ncbi:hypothetical protein [uncultured Methanolobus sp.]|uniref:hypothetical protein n=1 Tax=uncultured Methanolobus sp. TaxID=218300 RepID=UPI002AAAA9A4|nr:hypothetical protein [uncultured Methanolobus sp.]
MDFLIDEYNNTINQLKKLKSEPHYLFKIHLIEITEKSLNNFHLHLPDFKIGDKPIIEDKNFLSKKEPSVLFWNELLHKRTGKLNLNLMDALVIPSKIYQLQIALPKQQYDSFSRDDIFDILNKYKMMFEAVLKMLNPNFMHLWKAERKKNLEWSDISKSFRYFDMNTKKLFKSMNGQLRNAIAHESYVIGENHIIWIQDDGSQKKYPIEKVLGKIFDLYALIIALYWGWCEVYGPYVIQSYKKIPANKLKSSFNSKNLESIK